MTAQSAYEDKIRILTNEYLTGVISDEDKAELIRNIKENDDARAICKQAFAHYERLQKLNIIEDNELPADLQEALMPKKSGRVRRISLITVAASVCLILTSTYVYKLNSTPTAIHPTKEITLALAGGKTITIPTGDSVFHAQDVTLNNSAGQLSFQGGAHEVSYNTLTVPAGMVYQLVLADGSKVWLNSATSLQFPFAFNGDTREITINGEAYLDIAPQAGKPFIVHLPGNKTVKVLGTSFNVNTYDSSTAQIALVSGAVAVQLPDGNQQQVKPGFQITAANGELQTSKFDSETVLAWKQGEYYFENTRLVDAIPVLTRWYGVQVVIDSKEAESKLFTGSINRHQSIEEFLKGIQQLMDVSYYYKEGELHIK